MRYRKIIILTLIVLAIIPLFSANAAGIIPCGRSADDTTTSGANESLPCTLCHLIVGIYNLIDWAKNILITVALVAIFISGIMYIVSSGNEQSVTAAKGFLKASVTGFAIVLMAWFLINITLWILSAKTDLGIAKVNWYTFTCVTQSTALSAVPITPTPTGPTGYPENTLTDAQARQQLQSAGINVTSTGNCTDPNNSNCTSLQGIPQGTINGVIAIKNASGLPVTITGGTETGHVSHGAGQTPVDLAWNANLASYIKNNAAALGVTKICTTAANQQYRLNCNTNETTEHIHIAF